MWGKISFNDQHNQSIASGSLPSVNIGSLQYRCVFARREQGKGLSTSS